jgi:sec-independent protein translocase protein TatA
MKLNIIAGWLGGTEILVILLIVVLLFGGKKIPELMRGLGKGVKEFKDATKEDQNSTEAKKDEKAE